MFITLNGLPWGGQKKAQDTHREPNHDDQQRADWAERPLETASGFQLTWSANRTLKSPEITNDPWSRQWKKTWNLYCWAKLHLHRKGSRASTEIIVYMRVKKNNQPKKNQKKNQPLSYIVSKQNKHKYYTYRNKLKLIEDEP